MSAQSHYRFGYFAQVGGFVSLALANIALPNLLGVSSYAALAEVLAFVGIACVVFNDGVAYIVIRHVRQTHAPFADAGRIVTQAMAEHFTLAIVMLTLVVTTIRYLSPSHHYSLKDWFVVGVTALFVAAYIPCVAVLTAMMRNQVVLGLTLSSGLLSFAVPIALNATGIDVRLSIAVVYFVCLTFAIYYCVANGMSGFRTVPSVRKRLFIRAGLVPLVSPTALRLTIIWMPVILFASSGSAADAASYKIATAVAFGALSFVPFHKQTMLSLDGMAPGSLIDSVVPLAVVVAGVGAVTLIGLAETLTGLMYSDEYYALARYLIALGPFLLFQTVVDIAIVELVSARRDITISMLCFVAAAVATLALTWTEWRWYPPLCAGAFILAYLLLDKWQAFGVLVYRSVGVGLLGIAVATVVSGRLGMISGFCMIAAALVIDRELRRSVLRGARYVLSSRRVEEKPME